MSQQGSANGNGSTPIPPEEDAILFIQGSSGTAAGPSVGGFVEIIGDEGSGITTVSDATTFTVNVSMSDGFGGGPFEFYHTTSGIEEVISSVHTVNTAGSSASFLTQVAGESGGDPYFQCSINSLTSYSFGIDNSDSNKCKISGDVFPVNPSSGTTLITLDAPSSQVTVNVDFVTSSAQIVKRTNVNATPYVVLSTDYFLSVDSSSLAITVRLPNAPTTNRIFLIKDRSGNAGTNNITVTTVGGVVLIDGSATFLLNAAYDAISLIFNGTSYEVF